MKLSKLVGMIAGLVALSSGAAFAAVNITTSFGVSRDGAGDPVAPGTLWAIIVDNGDLNLPQMNPVTVGNTSNIAVSSVGNPSPFWYANLSLSAVLGGDTVIAMGSFPDASGYQSDTLTLAYGGATVVGRAYGFYWFPGVTYTAPGTYVVGNGAGKYVGGVVSLVADAAGGTDPMQIPTDTFEVVQGAADPTIAVGGGVAASNFIPTLIVPETSTALLGALGALGLLRRRR